MLLHLPFAPVHRWENNPRSQAILDSKREDFAEDCWNILRNVFLKGQTVTNLDLINSKLTMSPTRRISDLGQYGIAICREMRYPDGCNTKVMHYWMEATEINRVMWLLLDGLKFEKVNKAA